MPATSKKFARMQIKSESPPTPEPYIKSESPSTPEPYIKSESPPTPEPHMQRPTSSLKRSATHELPDRKFDGSESFGKVRRHVEFKKEEDLEDSGMAMKKVRQPLLHTQDATLITNQLKHSVSNWRDNIELADSQLVPQHSLNPLGPRRWAIALQPEFSPISQEQLAAEVKGIYAGLVMIEAKCINIDSQKASHPEERLSTEQWQALVALHRTLLYEHHDFLMATQHPSANPALLGLATKYSMPARMWKHGIHAFLEVLRHRRPESQEYMLAFIYLAYQMMSLLLETVPNFTDTWIECLGDIARYRMAIEEDREIYTIWGGVAGRWYAMAADRHPVVGRLYHHSGILGRPSLRKFYLFARALTSLVPFLNAKETLATLCSPVLNDGIRTGAQLAETSLIRFHARAFTSKDEVELLSSDGEDALTQLTEQPDEKFATYGVSFAVTNVAALLGYGSPDNVLRQLFDSAQDKKIQASRPSKQRGIPSDFQLMSDSTLFDSKTRSSSVVDFCHHSFNAIVGRTPGSKDSLQCLLPFAHTMLVFFSSIRTLQSLSSSSEANENTFDALISNKLDWSALSAFLNLTASLYPITSEIEDFADSGKFPTLGFPLLEDYMIRGLVWTQWYFGPEWFEKHSEDDDGSRGLESDDNCKMEHRAVRVLFLGMTLARQSDFLVYDRKNKCFSAADDVSAVAASISDVNNMESIATADTAGGPCFLSVAEDHLSVDGDGYVVVPEPTSKLSPNSSTNVSDKSAPQDEGARATSKERVQEEPKPSSNNTTVIKNVKAKDQRGDGVEILGDDATEWVSVGYPCVDV
jgi:hypothetical protein